MKDFERNYRYQPPHSRPRDHSLPDLMTPAMPPLELVEAVRKRILNLRQRRQLRKLLAYDDHTLSDMGHSRIAIRRALHLPQNADGTDTVNNIHWQNMHPGQPRVRH